MILILMSRTIMYKLYIFVWVLWGLCPGVICTMGDWLEVTGGHRSIIILRRQVV